MSKHSVSSSTIAGVAKQIALQYPNPDQIVKAIKRPRSIYDLDLKSAKNFIYTAIEEIKESGEGKDKEKHTFREIQK